jgi:hypothetical protein
VTEFPTIVHMLRTAYNAEDGLGEDVAIRLYQRAAAAGNNRANLQTELQTALSRNDVSWRQLLCNDEYEVVDLGSEEEARQYARRILWEPLFGTN